MNNSPNTTPSVTEEFMPCPFCGDRANEPAYLGFGDWHVGCRSCPASVDAVGPDEAIAAWNTRTAAPQHTGLVIDLEKTAMQSLMDAAGQSNWIPPDYYMNDWVSDCREFLRTGKGISDTGLTDVERAREAYIAVCDKDDAPPDFKASIRRGDRDNTLAIQVATAAIAAMQQPVCADVKRLLREARSYVEQAGLRHHDVSGLLAEIDAVLLVSNRSGAEVEAMQAVRGAALEMLRRCNVAEDVFASVAAATYSEIKAHTALDIPTINEGEAK